jgi:hypothetical protein
VSTLAVYGDANDGYINSWDGLDDFLDGWEGSYSVARGGGTLEAYVDHSTFLIGQLRSGGEFFYHYEVYESFLAFDTSALNGMSISSAVLNLTCNSHNFSINFDIQIRLRDWGASLTITDWVAGGSLSSLTLLAHLSTSLFPQGSSADFTNDAMPANVNKTGFTRMVVCSSRTAGNSAPSNDDYVGIRAVDYAGSTSDPKLTITYSEPPPPIAGMPLVRTLRFGWAG